MKTADGVVENTNTPHSLTIMVWESPSKVEYLYAERGGVDIWNNCSLAKYPPHPARRRKDKRKVKIQQRREDYFLHLHLIEI
jgi:hypothetical protein